MGDRKKRSGESSFTLLETVIALGLLVSMLMEVSMVQGSSINLTNYQRKITHGIWLAKAIMSQVEYKWKFYDLKDVKINLKEENFDDVLCPKDPAYDCDYTYNLSIEKWDLPLLDMFMKSAGMKSDSDDANSEEIDQSGMGAMFKEQLKSFLGEELLKIAHVEVEWPEGAKKDSVDITYLITNQNFIDAQIENLNPVNDNKCDKGMTFKNGKCVKDGSQPPPGPPPPGAPPGSPGVPPPPPPPVGGSDDF